jgi:hypothetical protein
MRTTILQHKIKLQKGCTRLAAASEIVYQLFVHGRWFSPGTPDTILFTEMEKSRINGMKL